MSDEEKALAVVLADLRTEALNKSDDPAMAVGALLGAAADILRRTLPSEVAAGIIIASLNDALGNAKPDPLAQFR